MKPGKKFRSGSFVRWNYNGHSIYGIVLKFLHTRYKVKALVGDNRRVHPSHMTYMAPSRLPKEVKVAIAAYVLTGKLS